MSLLGTEILRAYDTRENRIHPFIGQAFEGADAGSLRVMTIGINAYLNSADWPNQRPGWFAAWFKEGTHRFDRVVARDVGTIANALTARSLLYSDLTFRGMDSIFHTNAIKTYPPNQSASGPTRFRRRHSHALIRQSTDVGCPWAHQYSARGGRSRRHLGGSMVARLTRLVRGVVVAVALALVVAAPVAAAQPARTVLHFPGDRVGHFQPGDGCTFGVTVYASPPAHVTITDFSDGTEVVQQYAMKRVITSDVTGKTFLDNQVYRDAEWIDPATGLIRGETSGQFIDTFWPGDIGPYGVVDENVSYAITGHQTYVLDPTSFATLSVDISGTITNICAAIS